MDHIALAIWRRGAAARKLVYTATALTVLVWLVSIVAAALDSVLVALVLTVIVLLPLASPLAGRSRSPRR